LPRRRCIQISIGQRQGGVEIQECRPANELAVPIPEKKAGVFDRGEIDASGVSGERVSFISFIL